jgi:hypothetical protein
MTSFGELRTPGMLPRGGPGNSSAKEAVSQVRACTVDYATGWHRGRLPWSPQVGKVGSPAMPVALTLQAGTACSQRREARQLRSAAGFQQGALCRSCGSSCVLPAWRAGPADPSSLAFPLPCVSPLRVPQFSQVVLKYQSRSLGSASAVILRAEDRLLAQRSLQE